jgi:HAD superfamily hydrolase (TIGR01509 family)
MLKALILDFNGVITNDEPIHLQMFQRVLQEEKISLTQEQYYDTYLGMDDRGCFEAVYKTHGRKLSSEDLHNLIQRKAHYYEAAIRENLIFFPGVVDFIKRSAERFRFAIASGALRSEITFILNQAELLPLFPVIISAEDVLEGKPDPETFQKALYALNLKVPRFAPGIRARECLVIEDSRAGIDAAHGAEMKCLAITNSYPAEQLNKADLVLSSLEGLQLEKLEELFLS